MDRWGKLVYIAQNKWEGWDGYTQTGSEAPEGVYYYVVKVGNKEYVGNVTLTR